METEATDLHNVRVSCMASVHMCLLVTYLVSVSCLEKLLVAETIW